eukprot:Pgem_evm1s20027
MLKVCLQFLMSFRDSVPILKYCCMLLRSLTFNRADNQLAVANDGSIPFILDALRRHPNEGGLFSAAFMCIQNLTWLVETNRILINHCGGIKIILDSINRFDNNPEVLKWGYGALQNLACQNICVEEMLRQDIFGFMKKAFTLGICDHEVHNYAIGVLRNIAYSKQYRTLLFESGILADMFVLMEKHYCIENVQNSILSLLFNMCIEKEEKHDLIKNNLEYISIIGKTSMAHKQSTDYQEKLDIFLNLLCGAKEETFIYPENQVNSTTLEEIALCAFAKQYAQGQKAELAVDTLNEKYEQCNKCDKCDNYHLHALKGFFKSSSTWEYK